MGAALVPRPQALRRGETPMYLLRVRYNLADAMQGTRGELSGDLSVPCSLAESQR